VPAAICVDDDDRVPKIVGVSLDALTEPVIGQESQLLVTGHPQLRHHVDGVFVRKHVLHLDRDSLDELVIRQVWSQ
jgi:hypothetical protein